MLTFLYYIQLALIAISGTAQLVLLAQSKDGTSLTWILYWQAFTVISWLLARRSNKEKPDLETQRMINIYLALTIMTLCWLMTMLYRRTAQWKDVDTINLWIGIGGTALTLILAHKKGWYRDGQRNLPGIMGHHWTRMMLALTFKSMPQFSLGLQMALGTEVNVAALMIIIGHISIWSRCIQAFMAARKAGFNQNLVALLISETSNGLSWVFFTYFWIGS